MSLSGVYSKPFSLLSVCICDVCNRVEIMKHFPIQSAALFRSNNTRERETERMREEEEKEAEKEEDAEDACFRGCCRVLKTTKRGTRDDDETNAVSKDDVPLGERFGKRQRDDDIDHGVFFREYYYYYYYYY